MPLYVPVLMYHRVADVPRASPGGWLAVRPDEFAAHVAWLAGRGWKGLALRDLAAALLGERGLPRRGLVLTFDDAARDVCENAPGVLERCGFSATLFPSTARVGGAGDFGEPLASWEELARAADRGFEIGSHGVGHRRLAGLPDEELERELAGSRAEIAARIGQAPDTLAYPFGAYDGRVLAAAERAGYRAAVTVEPGVYHAPGARLRLRRVAVYPGLSGAALGRRISRLYEVWHRAWRLLGRPDPRWQR